MGTSILTWAKKWPKWFRNDFSRAFERCLSFFSTATRSRNHGGRSNAPPPPAGGGKSRGPAGRGLTRALLGGGGIAKIRRPGFHPPYLPSFPQLLWKFRPKAMWGQVTRSGQVTQLQNNFPIAPRPQCFRESYETFGIWWDHQCLQNIYLGFLISVTSGQVIFATPHYKSMGKKSTPLYLLWRKPIWMESYRIWQLRTIRVKICIAYPSKGHLRSPEVTNRHLPITFDQKEIETWGWCQYVFLGQANRLICNMTHFGHHVTLAWLDLRSNFDLDLSKSFYIWFDAP